MRYDTGLQPREQWLKQLPHFLLMGPEKGGTTSLNQYLRQHPKIFMARIQGANYFSLGDLDLRGRHGYTPARYTATLEAYGALFKDAPAGQVIGESSPSYFVHARAAERIRRIIPEVKLITVLRHPAERAFSHFQFNRKQANEPLRDFEQALAAEPRRIADGWHYRFHYRRNGFYDAHLAPFFRRFPRQQIAVLLYDDFVRDPQAFLRAIFAFLGVDDRFRPDTTLRFNVSGVPRNRAIEWALKRAAPMRPLFQRVVPPRLLSAIGQRMLKRIGLEPEVRARLIEEYRADILALQQRIDRDLSAWLT